MIRSLQRVPGILLAEFNATNARAVVAHDAAVSPTSLIAAAQNAGVRVRVVGSPRATTTDGGAGARVPSLENRQLLIAAAVSFVIVSVVISLVPNAAIKREILIAMTLSLWAFFIAKSFVAHR